MKTFIFLILSFFSINIYSATCATTTRTNYGYGQILTSTALNTDLNQLVTKLNAMPGGCITDASLSASAMDSTFSAVLNGIQQGCKLTYSDSNTVSLGKCIATINGNLIKTTSINTVTWGCSGCSAEATSSYYYVYIKNGSSGTTVNLLISTVAPGEDGYDGSNNKVVGKFYNDASSNIDQYSIYNWSVNTLISGNSIPTIPGPAVRVDIFSAVYAGATASTPCSATPCAIYNQIGSGITSVTWGGAGLYTINFTKTYSIINCSVISYYPYPQQTAPLSCINCNSILSASAIYNSGAGGNSYGIIQCQGQY